MQNQRVPPIELQIVQFFVEVDRLISRGLASEVCGFATDVYVPIVDCGLLIDDFESQCYGTML